MAMNISSSIMVLGYNERPLPRMFEACRQLLALSGVAICPFQDAIIYSQGRQMLLSQPLEQPTCAFAPAVSLKGLPGDPCGPLGVSWGRYSLAAMSVCFHVPRYT